MQVRKRRGGSSRRTGMQVPPPPGWQGARPWGERVLCAQQGEWSVVNDNGKTPTTL